MQDHTKDAEFLNAPIANYQQIQTIFGCGVATGRFAMGSNEALGQPAADQGTMTVTVRHLQHPRKMDHLIGTRLMTRIVGKGRGCLVRKTQCC